MLQKKLFVKAKNKMKMKKNAFEPVNFEEEKKRDPKYKTELCKSWVNTNFCPYGNKCRFAHGKNELVSKHINSSYKKKPCNSFETLGYCPYGTRCNFKHDERKLTEMSLPYYYIQLFIKNDLTPNKRLRVFEEIINEQKLDCCSDSTLSNDEFSSGVNYNIQYDFDNNCRFINENDIRPTYVHKKIL